MSDTVIQVENLCHSYGGKDVLKNLSFEVKKGRIFGLLGKNGAGKSTSINIMMGFLSPKGGVCRIFGEPSHSLSPQTRARIGLLHETFLQYEFFTIAQAERFYASFYPKWNPAVFRELMDKLGLPDNRKIHRMSCGQRSQVTLALILAQMPELMILDDYSLGLDAGYRRLFLEYLVEYASRYGTTILITSHIVQDLERFVDDIVILDEGRTLISSSLEDFTEGFRCYGLSAGGGPALQADGIIARVEGLGDRQALYSFGSEEEVLEHLATRGLTGFTLAPVPMSLEDAFIGLTGKY
ncbi:ABC transporter ATP-binding protein [Desulfoluna sp.]|uniref:ABC transporter ATP-binding protein n=1 Tax=Desulfoluna sp. TaxID=2045199 RepID=UPI0026066187|nr:ABC transporter ATP-binding protein [Desulfoluna sp.]